MSREEIMTGWRELFDEIKQMEQRCATIDRLQALCDEGCAPAFERDIGGHAMNYFVRGVDEPRQTRVYKRVEDCINEVWNATMSRKEE